PCRSPARARSCWSARPAPAGSRRCRRARDERIPGDGRLRVVRVDVVRRGGPRRRGRGRQRARAPATRAGGRARVRQPDDPAEPALRSCGADLVKPRHRRFAWIGAGVIAIAVAVALVLNAFQSNLVFFFSPSQVVAREAPQGRAFRIGGLVVPGSLQRQSGSLTVRFSVTDTAKTIPVVYTGLLPDLFKEGKGVVA